MSVTTTAPQGISLSPRNYTELVDFAGRIAKSSMVPKDYQGRPDNIILAIQLGAELGLAPLQSLQNISVIGGRPAVWGDAMLGLCKRSSLCKDIVETVDGEGDAMEAVCIARRVGVGPVEQRFSVADARKASLWGKAGPWQQYPKRMLQMRARGFALRDAFPDVLKGLITVEEAMDIPFTGTTLDAEPEAPPPLRTAASDMKRPPKVTETATDPLDEPDGGKWLRNLDMLLANAQTRDEVIEIGGHHTVGKATADAPEAIKRRISELLAKAYGRFADDTEVELPEDERADEPV